MEKELPKVVIVGERFYAGLRSIGSNSKKYKAEKYETADSFINHFSANINGLDECALVVV